MATNSQRQEVYSILLLLLGFSAENCNSQTTIGDRPPQHLSGFVAVDPPGGLIDKGFTTRLVRRPDQITGGLDQAAVLAGGGGYTDSLDGRPAWTIPIVSRHRRCFLGFPSGRTITGLGSRRCSRSHCRLSAAGIGREKK
jgi:hypothetical protein